MLNFKSLFKESFYLAQNSDVAKAVSSGIIQSGLDHFQKFGQFEGRNFSASFDSNYYLQQNQDVAAVVKSGKITVVEHFLQFGQFEGRNPNIFFDTGYYLQQNQDVAAVVKSGKITAVEHFLQFGEKEGRNPGKFFDTGYYLQQNQDVAAAVNKGQVTAFDHFLEFGEKEGRNSIASYDNNQYLKRYSDVADVVGKGQLFSAYRHFVVYGESVENRFGVNAAPIAMDDTNSIIEGTAIKISVLANDTDLNKDILSITNFTQAGQGEVVDNKDGTFTYKPKSGFIGSDSFNYTITDSYDGIATGKVNINVVQKPSVTLALASISISAVDATATELGTNGTYRISRGTNTTGNLAVNLTIDNTGTYLANTNDYTLSGGNVSVGASNLTVTIADGQAFVDVTINAVNDGSGESDETLKLNLADATAYTIDSVNKNATVKIVDSGTVVTNINDSGLGSLRQALTNAIAFAGPNTVAFQLPTGQQTITLAAALPTITGDNADFTTIDGVNAANLTVSGNNIYRVFDVDGVNATFNNLTIANANADYGAGINQNGGTVNVSGSNFSNNLAADYGGGIYTYFGTLNVSGSTFSNNSNTNTKYGSAIDLDDATVTVTNSAFNSNTGGNGAIDTNQDSSTLSIAGSIFTGNSPANVFGSYTDGGGNTFNSPV